jgi:hypothetical protein
LQGSRSSSALRKKAGASAPAGKGLFISARYRRRFPLHFSIQISEEVQYARSIQLPHIMVQHMFLPLFIMSQQQALFLMVLPPSYYLLFLFV